MGAPSAEPVALSVQYIQRCLTSQNLGNGIFGHVFLGEDSRRSQNSAVKTIRPSRCDQETIKEYREKIGGKCH